MGMESKGVPADTRFRTIMRDLRSKSVLFLRKVISRSLVIAGVLTIVYLVWRIPFVQRRVEREFERARLLLVQRHAADIMSEKAEQLAERSIQLEQAVDRLEKHVTRKASAVPTRGTDLPGNPAELRPLPYPFYSYLSILSDPDSMKLADFHRIHELLQDEYQLHLGDQVFICNNGSSKKQGLLEFALEGDIAAIDDPGRFHQFLVAYHRGWIDGIHGWHSAATASEQESFELTVGNDSIAREITFDGKFHDPRDHQFVTFEYQMPGLGSSCALSTGTRPLVVRMAADGKAEMPNALTWAAASVLLPPGAEPKIKFVFKGERGATLSVRNLMLTNLCRWRAQREAELLKEYNIGFLTYSQHGTLRDEFSAGNRADFGHKTRPQNLFDNPVEGPNAYLMDVLEDLGVVFVNAFGHMGQTRVLAINKAIQAHRFNDGIVRYNLQRFWAFPKDREGNRHEPQVSVCWEPWLGFCMEKLLAGSGRFGDGGAIYTHWGCSNPAATVLSLPTRKQLAELKDRHYNLSGKRQAWERVWVAPASEAALFARALQGIDGNAFYEETSNTVHIRSWFDPVSRQSIPAPGSRCFGLANLTFYVRDSSTARVAIDGRPYTCFLRNPPDQTGKQSITLVDDSLPTTVFDEVDPLQRFGDAVSDDAEVYFRSSDAFQGRHCLELLLNGEHGKTTWTMPTLTSASTSHLRFAYRKTNSKARVTLRLRFQDGGELVATEGELGKQVGWRLPPVTDAAWHDVVLQFADLTYGSPCKRVPQGRLESFSLEASGAADGDRVFFDAISFLRNPCHPYSANGRVLLAGRTDPPRDGVKVWVEAGTEKFSTTTRQGYFFFPNRLKKNSIVKLYATPEDKASRYSNYGRLFELNKDEVELVIPLEDIRDQRAHKKLHKISKIQSMNAESGPMYKPRSVFVDSGTGTPVEFENHLQVNNLGFLDRDRRFENPDRARRLLFLGNCNLFGHSVPRGYQAGIVAEGLLSQRFGYPFEVMTLANPSINFGKYWPCYSTLGKKFQPDVVCIFLLHGLEILECNPELFAKYNECDPDHLPCHLFCSTAEGQLAEVQPDPEYYRFVGKDEKLRAKRDREKKQGACYMDGFDWARIYYLEEGQPLPELAEHAWAHFAKVLQHYRDEFARNGSKLVLVLSPEYHVQGLGGSNQRFTDPESRTYNTDCFPIRLARLCTRLSIGFVNTGEYIEAKTPQPLLCSWRFDSHPSAYGFEWMAEAVAEYLAKTNFCRELPGRDPLEVDEWLGRGR